MQPVAKAFSANIKRLISVSAIPALLTATAIINQSSLERAYFELGLTSDDQRCNPSNALFDQFLWQKLQALRAQKIEAYLSDVTAGRRQRPQIVGEMALGAIMESQSEAVHDGLNAILNGMIIGAWTAFETLASDLWREALNVHPKILASLTGKWHKSKIGDADEMTKAEKEEQESKVVSLQELQRANFDLSKTMGNVHSYRFKWSVLEGIRQAYGSAFTKKFDDIKTAIEDKSLDALAAARNVLVHKSGIVDSQFSAKHKGWPDFSSEVVGKPIQITGNTVLNLLTPSLTAASKLLTAVDFWLVNN